MTVLDTLEETGLIDKTIILRLADHGEGGLSHGMREKAYTAYEEMIHIPLIIHNPGSIRSRCRQRRFTTTSICCRRSSTWPVFRSRNPTLWARAACR